MNRNVVRQISVENINLKKCPFFNIWVTGIGFSALPNFWRMALFNPFIIYIVYTLTLAISNTLDALGLPKIASAGILHEKLNLILGLSKFRIFIYFICHFGCTDFSGLWMH